MIYAFLFLEPSIASREMGVGPLVLHICGRAHDGNGKVRTHISQAPPPQKKKKEERE